MAIKVAVPKEVLDNENRVALVPAVAKKLAGKGLDVVIEQGAGTGSLIPDSSFTDEGASTAKAADVFAADLVLKVAPPTPEEAAQLKEGSTLISFIYAHNNQETVKVLQERKITTLAMELIPRITRAQAMDALSSQANIAGYKSVLMGAQLLGRYFPMLTTAAGTIRPAKVVIVGVGVAGLQAIATARRLGAMVEAYDVRPETKEQIESLGAKAIDTGVDAAGTGGYARELTDEEKAKQAEALAKHISKADVVITTANIPGRAAPKIVTADMVNDMKPGAVIVDLAAEGGGNCELTKSGETFVHNNVTIHGPVNVPSMMAEHASEMYSKNIEHLLSLMIDDEGGLFFNWDDEVVLKSTLTFNGDVLHEGAAEAMGIDAGAKPTMPKVEEEQTEEAK